MKKILAIVGGIIVLLIVVSALASSGSDESADDTERASENTTSDSDSVESEPLEVEPSQQGTSDNPYRFGEPHSRDAGLLGAAWTISIDEVRVDQAINPILNDESTEGKSCTILLGSATLDTLDSEDLISNPFSFPSVTFVDSSGASLDAAYQCDTTELSAAGYKLPSEMELTQGASAQWMQPYLVDSPDYQLVAIENTVYAE